MALGVSADVLILVFVVVGPFMAALWLFDFVEYQDTSAKRVGKVVAVLLVVVPVTVVGVWIVPVYRDDGSTAGFGVRGKRW